MAKEKRKKVKHKFNIKKKENLIILVFAITVFITLGYLSSQIYTRTGKAYTFNYQDQEFDKFVNVDLDSNQPEIVELTINSPLTQASMDISGLGENVEIKIADQKIIDTTGSLEEYYFTITDFTVPEELTLPDTVNIYVPKDAIVSEAEITVDVDEENNGFLFYNNILKIFFSILFFIIYLFLFTKSFIYFYINKKEQFKKLAVITINLLFLIGLSLPPVSATNDTIEEITQPEQPALGKWAQVEKINYIQGNIAEQLNEKTESIALLAAGIDTENSITINLEYNGAFDEDQDGIEPTNNIVDLTVANSQFNVDEDKLCTKWTINENSICYGNTVCCNLLELESSSADWKDVLYLIYGKDGAVNDNTVSAQIIYANYSLDPTNPYSDIIYSDIATLPVQFTNIEKKLFLNENEIQEGIVDISGEINKGLRGCDRESCKIELNFDSQNIEKIKISNLKINYILNIDDFSSIINNYCTEYPCTVPIEISSESEGQITLSNFNIEETIEEPLLTTTGFQTQADEPIINVTLPNGVNMSFVLINNGSFDMGMPPTEPDEWADHPDYLKPSHPVSISNDFYIGIYELTQEQHQAIMGYNPSHHHNGECPTCPVETLSWEDTQVIVNTLNQMVRDSVITLPSDTWFRLPSEAEWEYTVRAGTDTRFYFDDSADPCVPGDHPDIISPPCELDDYSRWGGTEHDPPPGLTSGRTWSVGYLLPNDFGIYDMYGNVYEWCQDDWIHPYDGAPTDGSPWIIGEDRDKQSRGAYIGYSAANKFTSFFRAGHGLDFRHGSMGVRLVLDTSEEYLSGCDGVAIDGFEQCDGNDLGFYSHYAESYPDYTEYSQCAMYDGRFGSGDLACYPSTDERKCTLDLSDCVEVDCENNIREGVIMIMPSSAPHKRRDSEKCDGEDLNGKTCADFGHNFGTLSCIPEGQHLGCGIGCGYNTSDDCGFDLSACSDTGFVELWRSESVFAEYETIQDCTDNANTAGDICVVHAGIYGERISTQYDGVTFKAADGETAVMKGFNINHDNIRIEGFDITGHKSSLRSAFIIIDSEVDNCYIKDNIIRDGVGVSLDDTYFHNNTLLGGSDNITSASLNFIDTGFEPGDPFKITTPGSQNTRWACRVESVTDDTIVVERCKDDYNPLTEEGPILAHIAVEISAINFEDGGNLAEQSANNCTIVGNTITNIDYHSMLVHGTNHLFENNTFNDVGGYDHLYMWGGNLVFRNNLFMNQSVFPGNENHVSIAQSFGTAGNEAYNMLFERNFFIDAYEGTSLYFNIIQGSGHSNDSLIDTTRNWTFRKNVFVNLDSSGTVEVPESTFEHNTFYQVKGSGASLVSDVFRGFAHNGTIKNNMFIECGDGSDSNGWYQYPSGICSGHCSISNTACGNDTTCPSGETCDTLYKCSDSSECPGDDEYCILIEGRYTDYNYVAGHAPDYDRKRTSACGAPGEYVRFNFCEEPPLGHGINGGNPEFYNENDPLGPDGIMWTADDGLQPMAYSPVCDKASDDSDIGAYDCKGCSGDGVPIALFNSTQPNDQSLEFIFDASKSMACGDVDGMGGNITSYEWDFGEGEGTGTGETVYYTFSGSGTKHVTLTITNDLGNTSIRTESISASKYAPGLMMHLMMDGNLEDATEHNNDGGWVGTESYITPGYDGTGQAILLDGEENSSFYDYVEVSSSDDLTGKDELTVALWAKKSHADESEFVLYKLQNYKIKLLDKGFRGYLLNTTSYDITLDATTNVDNNDIEWHHYAMTYNGSIIKLYFDGTEAAQRPMTGTLKTNTNPILISKGQNLQDNGLFNGSIDEVRIYDEAKSAQYIYNLVHPSQQNGTLTAQIIGDTEINVAQNEFFDVTFNISCSGGTCGDVNVTLDPQSAEETEQGFTFMNWLANLFNPTGQAGFTTQEECSDANVLCVPSEYPTINDCAQAAQPGDTCYISEGTYNEQVTFTNPGTPSEPITLKAAGPGMVVIDGENTRSYGIIANDYITIDGNLSNNIGILIKNTLEAAIYKEPPARGIRVLYTEIANNLRHGVFLNRAQNGSELAHSYLHNNGNITQHYAYHGGFSGPLVFGAASIHHNVFLNNSGDAVLVSSGHDIYNNVMGHNYDGVDFGNSYNRIYNNEIYNFDSAGVIYHSIPNLENVFIYNNLIYSNFTPFGTQVGISLKPTRENVTLSNIVVAQNTIVDLEGSAMRIGLDLLGDVLVANNIMFNTRKTQDQFETFSTTDVLDASGLDLDYNLINAGAEGSDKIKWENVTYNYADFVANGLGQQNGVNADPGFISSNDFHISNTSVARSKATDLTRLPYYMPGVEYDIEGTLRSGNWDIGAYEFPTSNQVDLLNSDQSPNTTFTNITDCVNAAYPGQTCLVYEGSYDERIFTARDNITFKVNPGDRAVMKGIDIDHSYIRIEGFDMSGYIGTLRHGIVAVGYNGNYCEVINNNLGNAVGFNLDDIYFYDSSPALEADYLTSASVDFTKGGLKAGDDIQMSNADPGTNDRWACTINNITRNKITVEKCAKNSDSTTSSVVGNFDFSPFNTEGPVVGVISNQQGAFIFETSSGGTLPENGSIGCNIIGNKISNINFHTFKIYGRDHLIENNSITDTNGWDGFWIWGRGHIFRNNILFNFEEIPGNGNHLDFFQVFGSGKVDSYNILLEKNLFMNSPGQTGHFETAWNLQEIGPFANIHDWTFRNNVFYNIEHGALSAAMHNLTWEKNTVYDVGGRALNDVGSAPPKYSIGVFRGIAHNGTVKDNIYIGGDPTRDWSGWYSYDIGSCSLGGCSYNTSESCTSTRNDCSLWWNGTHDVTQDCINKRCSYNTSEVCGACSPWWDGTDYISQDCGVASCTDSSNCSELGATCILLENFYADYNYVTGPAPTYDAKDDAVFRANGHELFGINGGPPAFKNESNPLGADGIMWTDDDGLIPIASSPVCNTASDGEDIGAYNCEGCQDENPVAFFSVDKTEGYEILNVTFDASQSMNCSISIDNYNWNLNNGTIINTPDPVISIQFISGIYNVNLTVTNNLGNNHSYSAIIISKEAVEAGLVLYYKFDNELVENEVYDWADRNNTGEWRNGPEQYISHDDGEAAYFNGVDSSPYIYTYPDPSLEENMNALTVSLWAQKHNENESGPVLKKIQGYSIELSYSSSRPSFRSVMSTVDDSWFDISSPPDINNDTLWHHYALVYNGTQAALFFDGERVATKDLTGAIFEPAREIAFGQDIWGPEPRPAINASIDDVKIYDRALNDQEIRTLAGISSNLVELINPDQSLNNSFTNITDCANLAQPGQTCLVYEGTYDERISTQNDDVTFKVVEGETATMNGFIINQDYIIIDGFEITGVLEAPHSNGGITINSGADSGRIVRNNIKDIVGKAGIYIYFVSAELSGSNWIIEQNNLSGVENAIWVSGRNNTVYNNSVTGNVQDAIKIFGYDHVISYNLFNNLDWPGEGHTDFFQTHGLGPSGSYNVLIEKNFFTNGGLRQTCQLSDDGNPDMRNWTIRNNVFANINKASINMPGTKWYNNTFYNTTDLHMLAFSCITSRGCAETSIIKNNVFFGVGGDSVRENSGWYAHIDYCSGHCNESNSTACSSDAECNANEECAIELVCRRNGVQTVQCPAVGEICSEINFDADHNFVVGPAPDYFGKDTNEFTEPNGITGDGLNPLFINPNDIFGNDSIPWTADDGLIPIASSPLCNAASDGGDIGAYECRGCTDTTPIAFFSVDKITGYEPLNVSFDASGSLNCSIYIANYSWDFGDGTQITTSTPTISHEYSNGFYTATLTVTNDLDISSSEYTTEITVKETAEEGLVMYLNLDNNVLDWANRGNDGLWVGNDSYGVGAIGNAASFTSEENNGSYIRVDDSAGSGLGGINEITISLWAQKNANDIGSKAMLNKQAVYSLTLSGLNKVLYNVYNESGQGIQNSDDRSLTDDSINNTDWHHYALVYNGSKVKIFIDGILKKQVDQTGLVQIDTVRSIFIGEDGPVSPESFNGSIDEVKIYEIALTDQEIYEMVYGPQATPKGTVPTEDIWIDEPFYTTNNNPQQITLNNGQFQLVTFQVNATGAIDSTWDMFAIIDSQTESINSNNITVNIVAPITCSIDSDCDDLLFCNGVETCNAGTCQPGIPPNEDDGVSCTADSCNEATKSIDHIPNNAICDNTLFCDGAETCDANLDCQSGTPPDCNDGDSCTQDSCSDTFSTCLNVDTCNDCILTDAYWNQTNATALDNVSLIIDGQYCADRQITVDIRDDDLAKTSFFNYTDFLQASPAHTLSGLFTDDSTILSWTALWTQDDDNDTDPEYIFNAQVNTTNITSNNELKISYLAYCGSGLCDAGEDCSSCSSDCGSCGDDGGGGGGGGGGTPSTKCYPSWACFKWSSCSSIGKQRCLGWLDLNNCGVEHEGSNQRDCTYIPIPEPEPEPINETVEETPALIEPPEIPATFTVTAIPTADKIMLHFEVNSWSNETLEGAEVEFNINKGRFTHYVDYLHTYTILPNEKFTLDIDFPRHYLIDDSYEVLALLNIRGFKQAETSTTLTLEGSNSNQITGAFIGTGAGVNKGAIALGIMFLLVLIIMQIVKIRFKKRQRKL